MNKFHKLLQHASRDRLWLFIWLGGLGMLWGWDKLFLNPPALAKVQAAFLNTFIIAGLVVASSLVLGWVVTLALHFLEQHRPPVAYLILTFLLNIIRSIPQIVGILIGYVILALLSKAGVIRSPVVIILLMAGVITLFVFLEVVDLLRERIAYFRRLDFYNAMLVCGIRESRIINREILWKNSPAHILNKLISLFGMTIFLQCSIDFIVSVGLSTYLTAVDLPITLGNLLARIDSKQDILAIGHTLTHPAYAPRLLFQHLQGVSVAFIIVFSLVCLFKISDHYARRREL